MGRRLKWGWLLLVRNLRFKETEPVIELIFGGRRFDYRTVYVEFDNGRIDTSRENESGAAY